MTKRYQVREGQILMVEKLKANPIVAFLTGFFFVVSIPVWILPLLVCGVLYSLFELGDHLLNPRNYRD